jgi:hypothetical protein
MKADLKAKWIDALRSGEYQQTDSVLHTVVQGEDRYCCLGVLCKVMGAKFDEWQDYDDYVSYDHVPILDDRMLADGDAEELSQEVCRELGIVDHQKTLIQMNDGSEKDSLPSKSFAEIADYIEANIPADAIELSPTERA